MDDATMGVRTRARRAGSASAGVPESAAEMRIAELEARLARLEGEPTIRERGSKLMNRVVPPEAGRHFRNAGREQLLGIRSIVDFWIHRIDDMETGSSGDAHRHTIEIE